MKLSALACHVLPKGFHRIRHHGLLANGNRANTVAKARELLGVPAPVAEPGPEAPEPTSRAFARVRVPVVETACSSSRSLHAAARRGISRHQ